MLVAAAACAGGGEPTPAAPASPAAPSADGVALYAQHCASCHGGDLRGTEQGPSHLSVVYEPNHHGDDAFRRAIAAGAPQHHWTFGDMPPVAGLDEDEIESIIDHIRAIQEREGFEPYPP